MLRQNEHRRFWNVISLTKMVICMLMLWSYLSVVCLLKIPFNQNRIKRKENARPSLSIITSFHRRFVFGMSRLNFFFYPFNKRIVLINQLQRYVILCGKPFETWYVNTLISSFLFFSTANDFEEGRKLSDLLVFVLM